MEVVTNAGLTVLLTLKSLILTLTLALKSTMEEV